MLYFKDVGGPQFSDEPDGTIDSNDQRRIYDYEGNPYGFGLGLSLSYKNFRIDATFSGGFGGKIALKKEDYVVPTTALNSLPIWLDYWSEENPNATMPRPYDEDWTLKQVSSFWVRDAAVMRLKAVNVSYALPKKFLNKLSIDNARIFCNATNLWTVFDPYGFKDPSLSYFNSYPLMRTINFGLNFDI
jgi:hypothetical protein